MAEIKEYRYFAGGEWRTAENNKLFDVYRPYDRGLYARVAAGGRPEAKLAVDAAAKAFPAWSQTTPAERAKAVLQGGRDRQAPPRRDRRDSGHRNGQHHFLRHVPAGPRGRHHRAGRRVDVSAKGRSSADQRSRHSFHRRAPAAGRGGELYALERRQRLVLARRHFSGGGRQHGRGQAVRTRADFGRASFSRRSRKRPASRPASSTS